MTKIYNDPADFSGEVLSGFAGAFPKYVQQVPGGLVRAGPLVPGKVAVVVGGGTGHYPAFAGWVGPGMADGAVVGDVFASPSTQQIVSVALAADAGGGIFLSYGNYAGDVLNFNAARDQLIAAGVPTRSVVVTDDLASAPPEDRPLRRGTAGDLIVVKVAAAAAEAGYDLDGVATVAERVNKRTSSLSVAFSGCTPPGSTAPIFALAPGQMAVGMGLHGEAGISEEPLLNAAGLADLLVSRVLVERPEGATQAAVLVNGLGATRYEELFVLWHEVAPRLEAVGVEAVDPEVGELVTSLDMAGASLTIGWLDDESRGALVRSGQHPGVPQDHHGGGDGSAPDPGSPPPAPSPRPQKCPVSSRKTLWQRWNRPPSHSLSTRRSSGNSTPSPATEITAG